MRLKSICARAAQPIRFNAAIPDHGAYDADRENRTALGHEKCFVASDHRDSPLYRVFTPVDLFTLSRGITFT
jgi:hypothetical protein